MNNPLDFPPETVSAGDLSKFIQDSIKGKIYSITGECKDARQWPDSSWNFDLVTKDAGTGTIHFLPCRIWPDGQKRIDKGLNEGGSSLEKVLTDGMSLTVRDETRMWNNRFQLRTLEISSSFIRDGQFHRDQMELLARVRDRYPGRPRLHLEHDQVHIDSTSGVPFPHANLERVLVIAPENARGTNDFKRQLAGHNSRRSKITYQAITWSKDKAPDRLRSLIHSAHERRYGMIVLLRGGGHWSELQVLDDEIVAELIAASEVPVITAIGHKDDVFLADRVARASFVAPSAAASAISKSHDMQFSNGLKAKTEQKAASSLAHLQEITMQLADARTELDSANKKCLALRSEAATLDGRHKQDLLQMARRRVVGYSRLATGLTLGLAVAGFFGASGFLDFFGIEPTFRAVLITRCTAIVVAWFITWRLDIARQRVKWPAARPMRLPLTESEWTSEIKKVRTVHRLRKLQRHPPFSTTEAEV
jgi:hypothetical protein